MKRNNLNVAINCPLFRQYRSLHQKLISTNKNNSNMYNEEYDFEEDYYEENDYVGRPYYDEPDYERDTFYALTDGMYGDYEDFCGYGGDFDSLMDGLGY